MSELSLNNTVILLKDVLEKGHTMREGHALMNLLQLYRFEENIAEAGNDGTHQIGGTRMST